MTDPKIRASNRERQTRHREGLSHQIKAIRAELQDLRSDVREVVKAALVRKSISSQEAHDAD